MKYLIPIFIAGIALMAPEVAFAYSLEIGLGGIEEASNLTEYLQSIYVFLVGAVGIVATAMIMWGGIKWILAAGSADKIGDAKKTVIEAIIGLVLVLASFAILNVLNSALVTLKYPDINQIVVPTVEKNLPGLNACAGGKVKCKTAADCLAACGEQLISGGGEWSCDPFPGGKTCIAIAPNTADGKWCKITASCLPGHVCVLSSPSLGICSELKEGDACDPAVGCPDPSIECIKNTDPGFIGELLGSITTYQCAPAVERGYDAPCTTTADCGPSLACKVFGAQNLCRYQYNNDCQQNLGETQQGNDCKSQTDCRTNIGGKCISPEFCCETSKYGTGRCDEAHRGSCIQ